MRGIICLPLHLIADRQKSVGKRGQNRRNLGTKSVGFGRSPKRRQSISQRSQRKPTRISPSCSELSSRKFLRYFLRTSNFDQVAMPSVYYMKFVGIPAFCQDARGLRKLRGCFGILSQASQNLLDATYDGRTFFATVVDFTMYLDLVGAQLYQIPASRTNTTILATVPTSCKSPLEMATMLWSEWPLAVRDDLHPHATPDAITFHPHADIF